MGKRTRLKKMAKRLLGGGKESTTPAPKPAPRETVIEEPEEGMIDVEVGDEQLAAWLADEAETVLLDIREPMETRGGYAAGALLIPMNSIPQRVEELPAKDSRLLVYCAAGARSFGVTHWLREQGWSDSWSVTSGFSGVLRAGVEMQRD